MGRAVGELDPPARTTDVLSEPELTFSPSPHPNLARHCRHTLYVVNGGPSRRTGKAALFKARSRLGPEPPKASFAEVARPLAGEGTWGGVLPEAAGR